MDEPTNEGLKPPGYEIRVRGILGDRLLTAFPDLLAVTDHGDTLLLGHLPDQSALHGVLGQIESLGLELVEVRRRWGQEPGDGTSGATGHSMVAPAPGPIERMETVNKIIVAVLDSEKAAYEGATALKDLHRDGDITLYASSVIAKDDAGVLAVRQAADSGPLGTLVGIVGGSLVGLLGGPAGALLGGWVGGGAGLVYDLYKVGVDVDLMDQVAMSLTPGKVALVADVDESWTAPVDARLEAMGASVFRRYLGEVAEEQLAREAEAAEIETRHLVAELDQVEGEAKAKVQAAAAAQRAKVEAIVDRIDSASKKATAEVEARLATLHAQLDGARDDQRNRIEARINDAKVSHKARQEKLAEARKHAKAALELTGEAIRV